LSDSRVGILCLTPDNLEAPWLLFEAGALAKTVENTFVCPYLLGLTPTEIPPGPLTQFQAKEATRDGTLDLIRTLNASLHDNSLDDIRLKRAYDRLWPELEAKLQNAPSTTAPVLQRTADDKTDEILSIVRSLQQSELQTSPRPWPTLSTGLVPTNIIVGLVDSFDTSSKDFRDKAIAAGRDLGIAQINFRDDPEGTIVILGFKRPVGGPGLLPDPSLVRRSFETVGLPVARVAAEPE
jgi:hypothetical protein